jgi:hypothetical protein
MDRYPSIGDHGLIGDLQTEALVTTDGTGLVLLPAVQLAERPCLPGHAGGSIHMPPALGAGPLQSSV